MQNLLYKIAGIFIPVLILAGCEIPVFSHPLVDPSDATIPAELLGSYQSVTNENVDLKLDEDFFGTEPAKPVQGGTFEHVGPAGDGFPSGFIRIVQVEMPGTVSGKVEFGSYIGFVSEIGDSFVFHIPMPKGFDFSQWTIDKKWIPENYEGYLLCFLKPTKDGVELRQIDYSFLISEIENKRLSGEYRPRARSATNKQETETDYKSPELKVTASTEELREFFEKHADGKLLDKDCEFFRRISKITPQD